MIARHDDHPRLAVCAPAPVAAAAMIRPALAPPVASRAWRGAIAACAGVTACVGLLAPWRQPMTWEAVHDVDEHPGALWQVADGVLPDLVTGRDKRFHLRDALYRVCDGTQVELEANIRYGAR